MNNDDKKSDPESIVREIKRKIWKKYKDETQYRFKKSVFLEYK